MKKQAASPRSHPSVERLEDRLSPTDVRPSAIAHLGSASLESVARVPAHVAPAPAERQGPSISDLQRLFKARLALPGRGGLASSASATQHAAPVGHPAPLACPASAACPPRSRSTPT